MMTKKTTLEDLNQNELIDLVNYYRKQLDNSLVCITDIVDAINRDSTEDLEKAVTKTLAFALLLTV